jgi:cold shock CspA family protein
MTTGTVKWFNLQKGFGREGQKLRFELSDQRSGKMSADSLTILD